MGRLDIVSDYGRVVSAFFFNSADLSLNPLDVSIMKLIRIRSGKNQVNLILESLLNSLNKSRNLVKRNFFKMDVFLFYSYIWQKIVIRAVLLNAIALLIAQQPLQSIA